MTKTILVFSIVMSVLLFCANLSGNHVFAKPSDAKPKTITNLEEKKKINNAKSLAEELRQKMLEKIHQDYKSKKDNSKKQIALEAIKKLDTAKSKKIGSN
ncbi:MAG: hypothetical protein QXN55_07645 [Candidatus Nitrosotenuis sp.]|jgi:hypothetical protein